MCNRRAADPLAAHLLLSGAQDAPHGGAAGQGARGVADGGHRPAAKSPAAGLGFAKIKSAQFRADFDPGLRILESANQHAQHPN